jgi:FtsH-binding integral membrane protein
MADYEMTRGADVALPSLADERVRTFLRSVYGWMCIGLAITAVTAMFVASTPALITAIATNRLLFWGVVIAQFGIVLMLSARVQTLAPSTASMLFVAYSALTGLTLSFVLVLFTGESVASTFIVSAGMFGATALYGSTTKRSLSGFGQFLFMGLVGLLLATFVGMFWHNDGLQFMISIVGVFIFTGLAAYDAQRLKQMALALPSGQIGSASILGALSLYLDFINLFLMLLRFMGSRRD